MEPSVRFGQATIPLSLYLAFVRFPQTQGMLNGAQDRPSSQRAESIEDAIRTALHEPQLLNARGGHNGRPQHTTDVLDLYGVKQKPLGITQILRDVLGLPTDYDRISFLVQLEESRGVRGADQVATAYHLSVYYGLTHYSKEDQRTITMAVLDCINRLCAPPLDLARSVQVTDLLIDGFGLEDIPRLMKDYRPLRKLGALVPRGDVYAVASVLTLPESRKLPPTGLMRELGYNPVQVGGVPILYHRFVNTR